MAEAAVLFTIVAWSSEAAVAVDAVVVDAVSSDDAVVAVGGAVKLL